MIPTQEAFNQIAMALARHFVSLYYIDIETGNYCEYIPHSILENFDLPKQGTDFFKESQENAKKCVHPDDLDYITQIHDKETMLRHLSEGNYYSAIYRLIHDGKTIHVRHFEIMCEDKKHIICCLENFEKEFRRREELDKNFESAQRMARHDELTGIRNKNAFMECTQNIDIILKSKQKNYTFGIVVCDMNDLKLINDTRGHSFGDEALQRCCRMICEVFKHSPVFRIGGDEFVVVLNNQDYDIREYLLDYLRYESEKNNSSRSGPVVASGMAIYNEETDNEFADIFKRADHDMYQNKKALKSIQIKGVSASSRENDLSIPEDRKQKLDSLFGALYTVAGEGKVFLNDIRYDYSRWSLPLTDEFDMQEEYMYHADRFLQERIHPDDMKVFKEAVDAALSGKGTRAFQYRARKADGTYTVCSTRCFIMNDSNGVPEYFGGIIITE